MLVETIPIEDIAANLQINKHKVKSLVKKHSIPYIKIGHKWRVEQESYLLLLEKLRCHSGYTSGEMSGTSKVKFTSETTASPLDKLRTVIQSAKQKK